MRKFIQIIKHDKYLIALGDDGSVWERSWLGFWDQCDIEGVSKKPMPEKARSIYLVVVEGAYRHQIIGAYDSEGAAIVAATEEVERQPDSYHAITVLKLETNRAVEDGMVLGRARKGQTYALALDKLNPYPWEEGKV